MLVACFGKFNRNSLVRRTFGKSLATPESLHGSDDLSGSSPQTWREVVAYPDLICACVAKWDNGESRQRLSLLDMFSGTGGMSRAC